jgi:putative heme-binding domain-containing protein
MLRIVLAVATAACSAVLAASGQAPTAGAGRASPEGAALYAARCADCHGADATGVRGPDLTRLWGAGATDERVYQVIRQGVAGSIMPASTAPDAEIRALVAYLKALGTTDGGGPSRGSAAPGEATFWRSCGGCHRVGPRGGRLGPDLTRIGVTQSADALRTAIRRASAAIVPGYQSVTLVTTSGAKVRGLRKGEDAFSVQMLDTRERLQGYLKADLTSVTRDTQSLMPDYGPDRLSDAALDDLVKYLSMLKGQK